MASFNGLKNIAATSIQNSGEFYLGNDVDPGTAGQALVSAGPEQPARWDTHTGTIQPLTMGTNLSLASGSATFNGGTADTINATDTDTTYQGSSTINIDTSTNPDTINCIKVPNALTKGTNITFSSGTTYDGSSAITINASDTDTQLNLVQGANIVITNTGGLNRTIALNDDITNQNTITFTSGAGATALTGNDYPQNPTPMTNFDLTDTSNIVSPYFFHDVYDPASLDSDALSTSYANIFSSNLFNSFTAKQTSVAIELRVYNAQFSTFGRSVYARLNGSSSTATSAQFTTFYSTGGRDTTRLFHQADESDDVYTTMTWFLTGLTIGNSYNLYPQMRSSSTTNSIYAGGSYPACILRGYYLPTTGF